MKEENTGARRQREYVARKRRAGYVPLTLWARPEWVAEIRRFVENMGEIDMDKIP